VEEALIERIRAGDDRAIADLALAYSGKIFRMAFRYLRNREDAEEVVQDVLLTIARKADAFRGEAALSSWVYRIAFNATMTRMRRARTGQPWQGRGTEGRAGVALGTREGVERSAGPEARVYRAQLRRRLRLALLELPAHYRAPVVLRDLRGLSTAQAGAALAIGQQTLKSRLHRERVMLRDRLSDLAGELVLQKRRPEGLTSVTS
jgi:RNA polymerase sigma-70 factor (ECF subfamily)